MKKVRNSSTAFGATMFINLNGELGEIGTINLQLHPTIGFIF